MKRTVKFLIALFLLMLAFSIAAVSSYASGDTSYFDSVVLTVGSDENERGICWYSTVSGGGSVRYSPSEGISAPELPTDASEAFAIATIATNKPGYYSYKATMSGLLPDTEYTYQLIIGSMKSSLYTFRTDPVGAYDFVFVGDPQLSTAEGGERWADTLFKIEDELAPSLIVLAGDNIVTPDSEEQYDYFLVDAMSGYAFAPTVGPAHDDPSIAFSEHFNIPNLSDSYGVTVSSANYYYTYNNTLFMHLNMADSGAVTNGEHKVFMENAIEACPGVSWKIVVLHTALFSAGMHSDTDYAYFDGEIGKYREYLAPALTELGVDLVLSGHDHIYVRSQIMNGKEVGVDISASDRIHSPAGTLHIAASSSTGTKFYDNFTPGAEYIAKVNDERRKSAVHFSLTDTSLTLNSYFLDDMSIFDSFTITKSEHIHSTALVPYTAPSCESEGIREHYLCECGLRSFDSEFNSIVTKSDLTISSTGHSYTEASCTQPKKCINEGCRATVGKANGHDFLPADCENPIKCRVCGTKRGAPLGHQLAADCDTDCDREGCSFTREPLSHNDIDGNGFCDDCRLALSSDSGNNGEINKGGESGGVLIPIGIAAVAIVVVFGAVILIRKRHKK